MLAVLLVAVLLCGPAGSARSRAAGGVLDGGARIAVVLSHPDDEVLLAPYLARRCVAGGAQCTIVVMTRGEAGICVLPAGCGPDRAAVRTSEMRRSAALLNAQLVQWDFPDVMADVAASWENHAGSRAALVQRLADAIADAGVVLTFDPRHGTTCHPAHRETGTLVGETGFANVLYLETAVRFFDDTFALENAAPSATSTFIAGEADWSYAIAAAEIHASQFTAAMVETLRTMPEHRRRVWLMPAGGSSSKRCE